MAWLSTYLRRIRTFQEQDKQAGVEEQEKEANNVLLYWCLVYIDREAILCMNHLLLIAILL